VITPLDSPESIVGTTVNEPRHHRQSPRLFETHLRRSARNAILGTIGLYVSLVTRLAPLDAALTLPLAFGLLDLLTGALHIRLYDMRRPQPKISPAARRETSRFRNGACWG